MNVRITKIFGREITIQDEELEMPKYFKIKGVVKEPSWLYKNKFKIILSLFALLVLASLVVGIGVILKRKCDDGYSGISCENYDACWNNPCEKCLPTARNSFNYTCCGEKSLGLHFGCEFSDTRRSASYTLIELRNGSIAAGYENSTIIIWKDNTLTTNTKLNGHEKKVKSLALFGNDLLASGSCDSTIKLWNLTSASNIKNVTGHEGCVNSLISVEYFNKSYLISASDDSTIKIWNSSFDLIKTNNLESITALAYDPISKYVASGSRENKINLYTVSFKLLYKNDAAHRYRIRAICVLKNGLIATGSDDSTIKIWRQNESKTLELVTTLSEHKYPVFTLAVLSNGSLISGSADETIKVWNQINETSFECYYNLTPDIGVGSLAVFNNLILSGLSNGFIYVWNETSFQLIQILSSHIEGVWSMIALDNQSFASASNDGTIKIWKINSELSFTVGKDIKNLNPIYSLALLKNGHLVSAGLGLSISIWQKDTFELIKVLIGHLNTVFGLEVLENGNLISVSADKTIVIWDSYSLNKLVSFEINDQLRSVAIFSNDSFITGTPNGSISIWNTESIDLLFLNEFPDAHSDSVLALKFIRPVERNLILLSASDDKSIKVWDMEIFKCIQTLTDHTSSVTSLIQINQKSFASGSSDKSIKIWNFDLNSLERTFRNVETIKESLEDIIGLAVLNETKIVISSVDRFIRVFNKSIEIKQIKELKGHSKSVQDIAVLDENLFASCSGDKTILIWNNSISIFNLTGHTDYVFTLEYSREINLLISGSKDTTIRLWNISSSFSLITTLYYHEDSIFSLVVLNNPDQTLISGSCDFKIVVWNLNTFKVNLELEGHKGCVNTLVLYNSDKYLVSGSTDTTIIIWDISNKFKLTEILRGHESSVNSVLIFQENIVSASSDKSIKIWSKYEVSFEKFSAHSQLIFPICILDDGLIVTGSYDSQIKIWKKASQNLELVETLLDHFGVIYSLKCLSDQKFISSSADKTFKIWQKSEKNKFECVKTINHDSQVTSLSVIGNILISSDYRGNIFIWNMSSYESISKFSGHNVAICYLVSLNNNSFASSSVDTTIKIWKIAENSSSFKCIQNLTDHISPVYALAVLKEKYLISGSDDGLIIIWNFTNFNLIKILREHNDQVTGLAVLDNESFISVSKDKKINIWDIETLTKKKTLVDGNKIESVCTISDDSFITGNTKGDLKIWSYFKEHRLIRSLIDHKDKVLSLVLLNDVFLASASQDGIIRVWDNTFNFKEIKAHSKAVLSLKVFPKGTLISSSEDESIKTWNTQQYILEKTIS